MNATNGMKMQPGMAYGEYQPRQSEVDSHAYPTPTEITSWARSAETVSLPSSLQMAQMVQELQKCVVSDTKLLENHPKGKCASNAAYGLAIAGAISFMAGTGLLYTGSILYNSAFGNGLSREERDAIESIVSNIMTTGLAFQCMSFASFLAGAISGGAAQCIEDKNAPHSAKMKHTGGWVMAAGTTLVIGAYTTASVGLTLPGYALTCWGLMGLGGLTFLAGAIQSCTSCCCGKKETLAAVV